MREALQTVAHTLAIPRERCVLIALPHGEAHWNLDGLWETVQRALPDARRKQLERGRAGDGWFKISVDLARSVPGVWRQASGLIK